MTATLSTARLTLKQLTKASQCQVDWLRDPEVVRYSEQRHRRHSTLTQASYIRGFIGNSHIWGIYIVSTGEHVGNLTARHDDDNNIADIGIMIDKHCWGAGIATEAVIAASDWLINDAGIRKLHGGCMKANVGMVRVFERANYKFEAEMPGAFLLDGAPQSSVHYGKIKR